MKPGSKIIGLAVTPKSFLLAEVAAKGTGQKAGVQKFGEFLFPDNMSVASGAALGQALSQFLREKGFTARDVVVGLPAMRLLTRRKEVPAAPAAVAASTLRLQAETEFSDFDNLLLDYAGASNPAEPSTVLVIATNREFVDQCGSVAEAAGLRVKGITATSAALARATSRLPGGEGWVLQVGPNGAEVVVLHGEHAAHLRHLSVTDSGKPESIPALAGEIRRMMASIPRNGTAQTMAVWRGPSSAIPPGNLLEQRLNMPVTAPDLKSLVSTDSPEADAFAPAVALALAAIEPAGLPVDFLNSRLAPPVETANNLPRNVGIAIGALVLLLIAFACYDIFSKQSQLDAITAERARLAPEVKLADAEKKKLIEANAWIRRGPHYVACLRDVTNLFPQRGNTIWANSLSNAQNNAWVLAGKAVSDSEAQQLRNRMLEQPDKFANPSLALTEDPTTKLVSFTLQFTYLGME